MAFFNRALTVEEVRRQFASGAGARLGFAGSLTLHPTLGSSSFGGTVLADGTLDFAGQVSGSPTMLGFGFNAVSLALSRTAGGATATCTGRARLNAVRAAGGLPFDLFATPPTLDATFTRSGATTTAAFAATGVTTPLGGYAPTTGGFNLSLTGNLGTGPDLNFSNFQFGPFGSSEITNLGFGPLSGVIGPDGFFGINPVTRSLTLRNLTAGTPTVNFSHGGLSVNGSFDLKIQPDGLPARDFGDVSFSGVIQPGGTYTLTGSGILSLGGFTTDPFDLQFRSPDQGATIVPAAAATPNLNFGNLDVPLGNLVLNRNGFGYSLAKSSTTDWRNRWVVATVPRVRDRLDWNLALGFDFNTGALTGQLSSTFKSEVLPAAPKPPLAKTSFTYGASGGISSGGGFTVNSTTTGDATFKVPSWSLPGDPGWSNFNSGSFSVGLW